MSNTDDNDDRWERWLDANGITHISTPITTDDGRATIKYYRADGTEVIPKESYGYDAFTPFSKTKGSA